MPCGETKAKCRLRKSNDNFPRQLIIGIFLSAAFTQSLLLLSKTPNLPACWFAVLVIRNLTKWELLGGTRRSLHTLSASTALISYSKNGRQSLIRSFLAGNVLQIIEGVFFVLHCTMKLLVNTERTCKELRQVDKGFSCLIIPLLLLRL